MTLTQLLASKPVVLLDSAMGTELHRHGVDVGLPLWSANGLLRAPHLVRNIHWWNLRAGADVITTCSFRTNVRALRKAGIEHRWDELNLKAVEFAFEARERYRVFRPVVIAGSIAPVEDCYQPALAPSDEELREEHGRQAEILAMFGADILLAETMNSVREAAIAAEACAATGKEFAVSFTCGDDGALLSGEPLTEALDAVARCAPAAILVNCLRARAAAYPLSLLRATGLPAGVYANAGAPAPEGTHMCEEIDAAAYRQEAARWAAAGARLIGGCCGTTPEWIAALHDEFYPQPPDTDTSP